MTDHIDRGIELEYDAEILEPIIDRVNDKIGLEKILDWIRNHLGIGQVFEEDDIKSHVYDTMHPDDIWDAEELQETLDRLQED